MTGTTRRLAEFATGVDHATLPPDVVERARMLLMDQVGISIRGRNDAGLSALDGGGGTGVLRGGGASRGPQGRRTGGPGAPAVNRPGIPGTVRGPAAPGRPAPSSTRWPFPPARSTRGRTGKPGPAIEGHCMETAPADAAGAASECTVAPLARRMGGGSRAPIGGVSETWFQG